MSMFREGDLIRLWQERVPPREADTLLGIGDDAAVLRVEPTGRLLVSTDMMMEDVHFSLKWMSIQEVGFKAVSAAVSDIAAMGGTPRHILASVGLPPGTCLQEAGALYDGVGEACRLYGLDMVGGDTVSSPKGWVIDVVVLGTAAANRILTRGGGRPGDVIAVTGSLGGAAAGLDWLRGGGEQVVTTPEERWILLQMHRKPVAQVAAGRVLAEVGATACDDVTDGLAAELRALNQASGYGCLIESERIPTHPAVRNYARRRQKSALDWALFGGDDYQLVVCIPPTRLAAAQAGCLAVGAPLTVIGRVIDDPGLLWRSPAGVVEELPEGGFDHFAQGGAGP
ncbi:MAG: thiamine-phosphate kinase [Kyrpidia sp.]|nr:thiamine-phosphate kinase [Kyrpidia sp.]